MLARNLTIIVLTAVGSVVCYQKAQWNRHASTISEAITLIERAYVEDVDSKRLFEDAMSGMVRGLDPYSSFIPPVDYQQFQEGLSQEFGGIGVMVEVNVLTGRLQVVSPIPNSPADKAGVLAGDMILEIDGEDTTGLAIRDAVDRIHGVVGEPVKLKVLHLGANEGVELSIVRAEIKTDSVLGDARREDGTWNFELKEDPRLRLIRVTTFGERTVDEFRHALEDSQKEGKPLGGIIIDLRDNAGGLLTAAIGMCDMLLDKGTIVSTRGRGGVVTRKFEASPDLALDKSVPIVVLVNRFSASASEIVAACLQDHGRATIVGQRTWGKGTVQNVFPLEPGKGGLKLTTSSYWRPSNKNIHRKKDAPEEEDWGVRPDDGCEVAIPEEDLPILFRNRRLRDAYRRPATLTQQPASPGEPSKSSDAPKPDGTSKPSEHPKSDGASKPGETTKPDEPAKPKESAKPEESREPDATRSSDSTSKPDDPADPGDGDDTTPDGPSNDRDPARPIDDPQLRAAIKLLQAKLK